MKALTRSLLIFTTLSALIPGACKKDTTITYVAPNRKPPVVNAGPSQTIAFPVDSVLLTGAVTDTGSRVVSYLWSEVSGPDVPVISSEGSLSTKVHNLTPGSYVFQLTATDTFGLTGADTLMVTVTPPTSVTLNSNSNLNEIEYIGNSAGNPEQTNNAPLELGAETWTIGGVAVAVRAVFRFDLSTLPAIPVKSAKLTLYSNPTPGTANLTTSNFGTSNAMFIQRVNTSWTTAGASFATQPTVDPTDEVSIPQTNASALDLVDVDVTKLVNAMRTSGNYGFMIRLQNEVILNSRIFCSSRYADATKHPKLVLIY